jgi:Integral membrane protein possibly involved in chromosome condensation
VKPVLAVLVGGAVGTALRLAVDLALPHGDAAFPFGTLLVNVAGAFALGLLVGRLWPTASDWLKAGLGPGLLGSFTTFSALALSAVELMDAGAPWSAAAYLAASILGGLVAAALGLRLGVRPARDEVDG